MFELLKGVLKRKKLSAFVQKSNMTTSVISTLSNGQKIRNFSTSRILSKNLEYKNNDQKEMDIGEFKKRTGMEVMNEPPPFVGRLTRDQILDLVNQMLSHNEGDDTAKYKLSKINVDNSGYTFGRAQYDCGQRQDARNFIKKCLLRANVATDKVNEIMAVLADHTQDLSDSQLAIANNALSLSANKTEIDKYDSFQIGLSINHVWEIVYNMTRRFLNPPLLQIEEKIKNKIESEPIIFLQLVDYHNQFNLSAFGPLMDFLSGVSVNRDEVRPGKVATLDVSKIETGLLGEIRRFINEYTKYGLSHPNDCLRRQANIDALNIPGNSSGPLPNPEPSPRPNHGVGGEPGGITGEGPPIFPPIIRPPPSNPNPTPTPGPTPLPHDRPDHGGGLGHGDRPSPGSSEPPPSRPEPPSHETPPPTHEPPPEREPPHEHEPPPEHEPPIHNEPPFLGDRGGDHGGGGTGISAEQKSSTFSAYKSPSDSMAVSSLFDKSNKPNLPEKHLEELKEQVDGVEQPHSRKTPSNRE